MPSLCLLHHQVDLRVEIGLFIAHQIENGSMNVALGYYEIIIEGVGWT